MTDVKHMNVLVADDEDIVHKTLAKFLTDSGHTVESAYDGKSALEMIDRNDYDLALVDIKMPGVDGLSVLAKVFEVRPELSVVLMTGHGSMEMAVQALRLGAADFLVKPVKLAELDTVLEKAARIRELRQMLRRLRDTIRGIQAIADQKQRGGSIVSASPAMKEVQKQINMAVESQFDTILIAGETGVGKEVAAREIHFRGGHQKPFIAISCPALPENLVESELFGHMKGSFTSAVSDKPGCFELADGGTLFLDEVADLSPAAQAKLLRVLETRSVRRVGGTREINVNVRVIAATNTPIEELVKQKRLRQDLYYRLNRFIINIPPLRSRTKDIMPLAEEFLEGYVKARGLSVKGFSSRAKDLLLGYDFPGNVRELRNLVERAAILCRAGEIQPEHLSINAVKPGGGDNAGAEDKSHDAAEREMIAKALAKYNWNRRKAAQELDMPYSTLRYKISKYGL